MSQPSSNPAGTRRGRRPGGRSHGGTARRGFGRDLGQQDGDLGRRGPLAAGPVGADPAGLEGQLPPGSKTRTSPRESRAVAEPRLDDASHPARTRGLVAGAVPGLHALEARELLPHPSGVAWMRAALRMPKGLISVMMRNLRVTRSHRQGCVGGPKRSGLPQQKARERHQQRHCASTRRNGLDPAAISMTAHTTIAVVDTIETTVPTAPPAGTGT